MASAGMHNDAGVNIDLYIPRKWCVARRCTSVPVVPGAFRLAAGCAWKAKAWLRKGDRCPRAVRAWAWFRLSEGGR